MENVNPEFAERTVRKVWWCGHYSHGAQNLRPLIDQLQDKLWPLADSLQTQLNLPLNSLHI
jgi:hypothetical protein